MITRGTQHTFRLRPFSPQKRTTQRNINSLNAPGEVRQSILYVINRLRFVPTKRHSTATRMKRLVAFAIHPILFFSLSPLWSLHSSQSKVSRMFLLKRKLKRVPPFSFSRQSSKAHMHCIIKICLRFTEGRGSRVR